MARDRSSTPMQDAVISIIGPGMTVVGDCETDGTLRIEGRVEGTIRAGKAVVVGKDGEVEGKIFTQDAVLGGRVVGAVHAASRLEVQATARIDAEVRARRMQLEEGAEVNGSLSMGEQAVSDTRAANGPSGPRKMDDDAEGAKKAG